MNYSIDEPIWETAKLSSILKAAKKALELIRNPASSVSDVAGILGTDQVLSAQVLRRANSAYYGMENKIAAVQQATVVSGMNIVQELIMSAALYHYLDQPISGYELQHGELWHHALGMLVFGKRLKTIDRNELESECQSFLDVERLNFGIDYAKLGTEIARQWQLPENLATAIAFHHEPLSAQKHQLLVATIHIADVFMMILGVVIGIDGLRYPMEEDALKRTGMTWEDLFSLSEEVTEELTHAKEMSGFG